MATDEHEESAGVSMLLPPWRRNEAANASTHSLDTMSENHKSTSADRDTLGIPTKISEASWKDYLAAVCCAVACAVAYAVVFVQEWAVFWGQQHQFVWIGLCLTIMGWCTLPFVRRLYLCMAVGNEKSSNLQTLDAILRSDPLTEHASLAARALLVLMLALSPALSVVYKLLGGGYSAYTESSPMTINVGLTGPPGTQWMGYGMSQFVNATMPWFEQPGFEQLYGYNLYVENADRTAVLDAPLPQAVANMQSGLNSQWHLKGPSWLQLKGIVPATVCTKNPDLQLNRSRIEQFFNGSADHTRDSRWTWLAKTYTGILIPYYGRNDSTSIYVSSYNVSAGETFSQKAEHYNIARQNYSATWLFMDGIVRLVQAEPLPSQILDDKGVFTDLPLTAAIPQLMLDGLVEYDTAFRVPVRPQNQTLHDTYIKSKATLLGLAVWARYVAWVGPENWAASQGNVLNAEQQATLSYDVSMTALRGAVTVQRNWKIIITLLIFPVVLITTFMIRVVFWSRAPVGNGFGVISLLASADEAGRKLLDGAGLSGRLRRPLSVQITMQGLQTHDHAFSRDRKHGLIATLLGEAYSSVNQRLEKGVKYH